MNADFFKQARKVGVQVKAETARTYRSSNKSQQTNFTEIERQFIRDNAAELTAKELACKMCRSINGVRSQAKQMNVMLRSGK